MGDAHPGFLSHSLSFKVIVSFVIPLVVLSQSSHECEILVHYRYSLSMSCAQVRVLEKTHEVPLRSLLQCQQRGRFPVQFLLSIPQIVHNFANDACKRDFLDK